MLVFPRADLGPWKDEDYRNWRKRIFRPAALDAGLKEPRPYDLRPPSSRCSSTRGVSIVEVARQAGHLPGECLRTYAHTLEEFDPADRQPAEAVIAPAPKAQSDPDVRVCTRAPVKQKRKTKDLAPQSQADGGIRTHDPRFTRAVLWPTELRRRERPV